MNGVFSLNFLASIAAETSPGAIPTVALPSPFLTIATVLVFLCGLICDAYLLAKFVSCFQLKVAKKPWGLAELGIVVAVCFGILLSCNIFYLGLASILHKPLNQITSIIIPVEFISRIIVLTGFVLFFRARRYNIRESIGLNILPAGQGLRWGVIFGFAAIPPVLLVNLATERILSLFHFSASEQDIVVLFRTSDSNFLITTLILFAILLAPIFEEFLFRGFAYPAIKQRFGALPAIMTVSAIFALSHFHLPSLPALFLLAIGLSLAYELTGSLLTPITMHAIFNGVMVFKLLYDRLYS
jgi:membrane protease YdiL (CAAX protease family)